MAKSHLRDFAIRMILRNVFTPQLQPARRLTEADYQHITEIWETSGKHYEHELHILHPISSKYPTIFATSTTFRYFNC